MPSYSPMFRQWFDGNGYRKQKSCNHLITTLLLYISIIQERHKPKLSGHSGQSVRRLRNNCPEAPDRTSKQSNK